MIPPSPAIIILLPRTLVLPNTQLDRMGLHKPYIRHQMTYCTGQLGHWGIGADGLDASYASDEKHTLKNEQIIAKHGHDPSQSDHTTLAGNAGA